MRASWLEHSCLLASCVSLLFLIQGKTRINKSCMGGMKRTLTFFSSESPSCVSADYNSAWDRKYKRMLCSIRKMSHFSFYWHTVAGKKKKKRPLNVFTMTAVQVSRLIDFYFLLWLCWYFRFVLQSPVCPLCPSLSAFQCLSCLCYHAVSYLSWGYFRLVFCCVVFLIPVFVLLLFPDCLQLAFIPVWIICVSIGFYFVLPCDFVYLDYWSANKGFC